MLTRLVPQTEQTFEATDELSTAADRHVGGWRGSKSQHSQGGGWGGGGVRGDGTFPPATGCKRSGAVWEELLAPRWLLLACAVGVTFVFGFCEQRRGKRRETED